jgi:heat shock protein HslJ
MTFLEAALAMVISLTGSNWVAPDNAHQNVQFKTSQIVGSAGCNQFMGSYKQNDDSISVGNLAKTRKACAPALMLQESKFLAQLENSKQVEMTDNTLVLKDAAGGVLITLNRKSLG